MESIPYRNGLLIELQDPAVAKDYFVGVAQTGDRAALRQAVDDILEGRGGSLVELTKRRSSPEAMVPPGNWDTYRPGDVGNESSLPVDYTLIGILLMPPQLGAQVTVLRLSRNGVEVPGVFESTTVMAVCDDGFTTLNSVYSVQIINQPTH
jgi:hypothetical protein